VYTHTIQNIIAMLAQSNDYI